MRESLNSSELCFNFSVSRLQFNTLHFLLIDQLVNVVYGNNLYLNIT
jgi:hypothetical protein